MIHLKSAAEIEIMRENGRVLARIIRQCGESIEPGTTTTEDLDKLAAKLISEAGGTASFFNYRGYPASSCISVNEVVIHGIPGNRVLNPGDVVDIDVGMFRDGFHVDSAWTFPVGDISEEVKRLLNVTKESLFQGIAKAKIGNRVGDVSAAVQKYVDSFKYGIVRELVGHGIGRDLHEEPSVPNFGKAGLGHPLREGCTICIEPMINMGTHKVCELSDGWTIVTADGKYSAHFEHAIAITKNGPLILTQE